MNSSKKPQYGTLLGNRRRSCDLELEILEA